MILPDRRWNSLRGRSPYWDYLPHFLYSLFESQDPDMLVSWLQHEHLQPLFDGPLDQAHIIDLAGTGDPCRHDPRVMNLNTLLDNYIRILEERRLLMDEPTMAA